MELNLKEFKYSKFKNELKANQLLLIFNVAYAKNEINIKQIFGDLNLRLITIVNNISRFILANSIYFNYRSLINSFMIMAVVIKSLDLKELTKICDEIYLLGVKLQGKFYTKNQLQNIVTTIHFIKNIKFLIQNFKFYIKKFSVVFSSKSK